MKKEYKMRCSMKRLFKNLTAKLIFYFSIVTIIVSLSLGLVLSWRSTSQYENEFRNRLLSYAKTASIIIDYDKHNTLVSKGDMNSTEYREIKSELRELQMQMNVDYLYTIVKSGDKYTFVVDTDEEEAAAIGEECEKTSAMQAAFEGIPGVDKDFCTDKWGTFLSAYAPIKDDDGNVVAVVGVDVDANIIIRTKNIVRLQIIGAFILSMLTLLVVVIIIARNVMKPINLITNKMEEVANKGGDLTQRIEITSSDETGRLASAFNKLFDTLQSILIMVRNSAGYVKSSSGELASSMDNSSECVGMVTKQTAELLSGIEEVEDIVKRMKDEIESFYEKSQEIAAKSQDLDVISRNVMLLFNEVEENISKSRTLLDELDDSANNTYINISDLGEYTDEISNIVSTIENITKQTNMLAINAMIEAQHAGEYGKGFITVSENIRNLSLNTQNSAQAIKSLVNNVVSKIDKVVDEQSDMKPKIRKVVENFEQIIKLIEQTVESFKNATDMIKQISTANSSQASGINSLVSYTDDVFKSVREQVDSTQNTSVAIQELNATIEEIAANSESLSDTARDLDDMIKNFKL